MYHLLVILPYRFVEETLDGLLAASVRLNVQLSVLSKNSISSNRAHPHLKSIIQVEDERRTLLHEEKLLEQTDKLFKELPFTAVVNYAEAYVCLAAKLTERYKLEGNSPETALLTRDKYAMRNILEKHAISIPKFQKVSSFKEYQNAVASIGFPCISKPTDGAASNGVLKLTEATILEEAYTYASSGNSLQNSEILVESYISGQEVSVEGVVVAGKLSILGITAKKTEPEPFFNELMHIHPALLPLDVEKQLHRITEQTITALGIVSGGIHLEAKIATEGIFVIECASRPGGDNIPKLIQLASGYDMHECMLRSALHLAISLSKIQPKQTAGIIFVQTDQVGVLSNISFTQQCPKTVKKQLLHQIGDKIGAIDIHSSSRLGYIITQGDSYTEVHNTLSEAEQTLSYTIE